MSDLSKIVEVLTAKSELLEAAEKLPGYGAQDAWRTEGERAGIRKRYMKWKKMAEEENVKMPKAEGALKPLFAGADDTAAA